MPGAPVEVMELSLLKARTLQWRPARSAPVLTIICKATYKLAPGVAQLVDLQDDVNERDLHAENNPQKGLHSASDLAPFKPRADVTVVGRAYSLPRELARVVVARVKVGTVDKRVEVHADRVMLPNGSIKDDKFFSKMGIGYERAYGGPKTVNPVGVGLEGRPDSRGRVKLPNLQAPGTVLTGPGARLVPCAFGPIPPGWPSRSQFLGGQSIDWLWSDDPLARDLPADFQWAFFNVGPADQQLDEIRPDETIHLEHLHPDEPQLDVKLPGFYPCVYMQRADEAHRVAMKGDTLWIDTNRFVLTVTWRAQVPLEGDARAPIRVLVAMGTPTHKPSWDQVWVEAEALKAREKWANHVAVEAATSTHAPSKVTEPIDAPYSPRGQLTSPVPLAPPRSDRGTQWLPNRERAASTPGFSVPAPVSSQPASGVVVEVPLEPADAQRLRELAASTGNEPADVLRNALREIHRIRFGS